MEGLGHFSNKLTYLAKRLKNKNPRSASQIFARIPEEVVLLGQNFNGITLSGPVLSFLLSHFLQFPFNYNGKRMTDFSVQILAQA